jgi:hypothetical protein
MYLAAERGNICEAEIVGQNEYYIGTIRLLRTDQRWRSKKCEQTDAKSK